MSFARQAQDAGRVSLTPKARFSIAAALMAGLALRLLFVLRFPFFSGDTFFYQSLADNWFFHGVYGLWHNGQLFPEDMRVPGYPAFLAIIRGVTHQRDLAVRIAQCLLDLVTCALTAGLAALTAPRESRSKVFAAALWLAALCPFTANYAASLTTETLATFFGCAALLCLAHALAAAEPAFRESQTDRTRTKRATILWFAGGVLAGLGALVRPEIPILLAPFLLLLFVQAAGKRGWSRFLLFSLWSAAGIALCLSPWAARNALAMGEVQFLSRHYAETGGDFIPRGFYAWTQTWLDRYSYAHTVVWALGHERIDPGVLPPHAFDSDQERTQTLALLQKYNQYLYIAPPLDREFAALAQVRTQSNPARTHIWIPAQRALASWFTPRMELLPFEPLLWPPKREPWNNRPGFPIADIFEVLQVTYIALALAGAWRRRSSAVAIALVLFIALRTALVTQLPTVEPRYVIECFPALLALAAQVFS